MLSTRRALEVGLLALAFSAPLAFGGVPPEAVWAIEAAAGILAVLALLASRSEPDLPSFGRSPTERKIFGLGLAIAAWILLQWIPLPADWVQVVHGARIPTRPIAGLADHSSPWSALSYVPMLTFDAGVRWAAVIAVLYAAAIACRTTGFIRKLAAVLVASAVFQAGYGLLETLTGHQHIWGTPKVYHLSEATGTFVNRNHFAAYLGLMLPLTIEGLSRRRIAADPGATLRRRLSTLLEDGGAWRIVGTLSAAALWSGIVFSYSRAAFVASLAGMALFLIGVRTRKSAILVVSLVAVILPSAWFLFAADRAPGERIVQKLENPNMAGNRTAIWSATAGMALDHLWTGTGAGTFGAVFVHYQPPSIPKRWEHAHNELLQAAAEGGLLLLGLLLAAGAVLARAATELRQRVDSTSARIGFAAFAGLFATGLHSLVDFPFRLPAIGVTAGILVGIMLGALSQLRVRRIPNILDSGRQRRAS